MIGVIQLTAMSSSGKGLTNRRKQRIVVLRGSMVSLRQQLMCDGAELVCQFLMLIQVGAAAQIPADFGMQKFCHHIMIICEAVAKKQDAHRHFLL